jgi:hypothetical protein
VPSEISGHPTVEAHRTARAPLKITVCATCERVRSVLFLSRDRWFCTACRAEGDARPTQIPVSNPAKRGA